MPGLAKTTPMQAQDSLRAMVGEGCLREGTAADAVLGVVPALYVEPANEAELVRILTYANEQELQVAPRGGGTKLDWGTAPQSIDLMISTARFSRVLEHAPGDMTVCVESGVTLVEVQRVISQHGQRLALDPLQQERATVGGVIATNDSGALRVRYGGMRDLIIGLTVVLPDGTIATSGGKVVKNVAGYDLPKLMTGALGTLGFITRAVFRLHPLAESSRTLTLGFVGRERANESMLAVADSIAVPTGMQMRTGSNGETAVDVRIDGIAAGIEAQVGTVMKIAGDAKEHEAKSDAWQAREEMWKDSDGALICKLSVLPTQIGSIAEFVREELSENADWKLLMHSTGIGYLRVDAMDGARLAEFVGALRKFIRPSGGTAVVMRAPAAVREQVDVWSDVGSALPLMKRIKQQFDPRGILNRGRFVGGI